MWEMPVMKDNNKVNKEGERFGFVKIITTIPSSFSLFFPFKIIQFLFHHSSNTGVFCPLSGEKVKIKTEYSDFLDTW